MKLRTLKFIVEGQVIKPDPSCDFTGLVPGTEGYLRAEFSFSPDWKGYTKVAAFYSIMGREYPPKVLANGTECLIPVEALAKRCFKVRIIGKKDGVKMATNKVTVCQNGGRV